MNEREQLDAEQTAALKRAFRQADGVVLDGHTNQWLWNTACLAQEVGILGKVQERGDEQWTTYYLPFTTDAETLLDVADE